ncbi:MAG TPA: threonine synthase, partial [Pseudolabrys sp.]|nr:threonine synthase [Pseudolabrys sp.]
PTGNFGDVYAGYVARRMGLPVDRLVVATNVNDILVRAFASGDYEVRDVVPTTSPSMDIQVSSNFERLLFDAYARDAGKVSALMGSLAQSRRFAIAAPALKWMRELFTADRADAEESNATMRAWMREAGYCADPHTAVALAVAEKEARDPSVPMVVLSTAHPAKFPQAVEGACGGAPNLPEWLADLPARKERVTVLPADQAAVERFVASASRAAREGAAA